MISDRYETMERLWHMIYMDKEEYWDWRMNQINEEIQKSKEQKEENNK